MGANVLEEGGEVVFDVGVPCDVVVVVLLWRRRIWKRWSGMSC